MSGFCSSLGIEFYAANKYFPEKHGTKTTVGRFWHLFIDRNLGGIQSWKEIFEMICPEEDIKKGRMQSLGGKYNRFNFNYNQVLVICRH